MKNLQENETENKKINDIKIYICDYCNSEFSRKYTLTRHLINCKIKITNDDRIFKIKSEYEKELLIQKYESKLIEKDYENKLSLKDKDIENIKLSAELKGLKEVQLQNQLHIHCHMYKIIIIMLRQLIIFLILVY